MSLQVTMMICFYDLTHQERCQVPWLMALAPKTWYAKGAGVENYPGCHEFQTQCFCFSGLPSLCLWMCWQVLDGDQTVVLHRRRTHQWTACQPAAYKDQWARENISQMFYLLLMLRKKKYAVLEGGTGRWRLKKKKRRNSSRLVAKGTEREPVCGLNASSRPLHTFTNEVLALKSKQYFSVHSYIRSHLFHSWMSNK